MKCSTWLMQSLLMVGMALAVFSGLAAAEGCAEPDGFLKLLESSRFPKELGDRDAMAKLLSPRIATPQLSQAFNRRNAETAVDDKLARDRTTCPSSSSEEDGEGKEDCTYRNAEGSAMRLKLEAGKIAYLNPERRFEARQLQNNQTPTDQALETSQKVLEAFGVPRSEINARRAVVRELLVTGRDKNNQKPAEKYRAEVHVLLPRYISGTPVFDSEAKTAIDARGQVARLHIKWPDFQILPGLSEANILSREEVIRQLNAALIEENKCDSLSEIRSFIAYVSTRELALPDQSGDEQESKTPGSGYLPALVVYAVPNEPKEDSGEIAMAGQQLVIPLLRSSSEEQTEKTR